MSAAAQKAKARHVYRSGAAGCGGKPAPVNAKNTGQPLPCPFCDRIFKQDGRLKEHLKNKHADDELPSEDAAASTSGDNAAAPAPQQQASTSYPVKMPKTLLHEWCQKNKRPAPKFMHVEVEGGFQCRVILPDPKKSELDVILWFRYPMQSSQEAHHRAAVMALHHVMGNRRLDRILPEDYRQQWHDLDIAAAEREAKLKMKLQKPKKALTVPKELQSVFMSEGNRRLVEEVLMENGNAAMEALGASDYTSISSSLLEMGFKEDHIKMALDQANDISGALDWLMLHVEESELPVQFAPQSSKSVVRIVQRSVAYASLPNDEAWRLQEYGYDYEDCVAVLQESGSFEEALSKLFYTSLRQTRLVSDTVTSETFDALREEEIVAISSIYPGAVASDGLMTFSIELSDKSLEMEVRIPTDSSYPFEVPLIGFRGKALASHYLQRLTQRVAERALDLVGMPMVYELVMYASEISPQLLVEPRLSSTAAAGVTPKVETSISTVYKKKQNSGGQRRMPPDSNLPAENLRLKEDWEKLQISTTYAEISAARKRLPAYSKRTEILAGINRSAVSIICGETGCGKSTQVPQYILEESIEMGKGASCSIICTQPRRISALGLASRVANERMEAVGKSVGYTVRLDSCCSKYTRLLYCTTGILLRRLLSDPELQGVTHIIVDEVHERTLESDLLLLLLKSHIQRNPGTIRLILMSATAEATTFASYFEQDSPTTLRIPGFTYPVRNLYLEDVFELTGYRVTRNSQYTVKKKSPDASLLSASSSDNMDNWESLVEQQDLDTDIGVTYSELTKKNVNIVDESIINYELIEKLLCTVFALEHDVSSVYGPLTAVHEGRRMGPETGSVLVFLPGMMEIKKLQARLQNSKALATYGIESKWVLALHGSLSGEEQKRVFLRPPKCVRKLVLATNVAETSITIDDIVYVIDTGRHKEMSYEHSKGLSCLQETWISKANSKQRAGRAGRVQPGCCLRLFSRKQYSALAGHQLPEIQRISLEGLCLKVKSLLPQWRVEVALARMLTPPDPAAVSAALQDLKDINAFDPDNESLTPLGKHLAQIPVDARVGKMLIFGCMLKCLSPILTIAAAMSGRPLFLSPQDSREEARLAKQRLSGSSKSDHLAVVAAYNGWVSAKRDGWTAEKDYCETNFLSRDALVGIDASREDYLNVLRDLGFITGDDYTTMDTSSSSIRVIKAVVCAGFYPNVARIRHPEKTYVQTEGGTVPRLAAAHEVHYFTKSDGRVFLHPASVNFSVGHFESPWLVVTDKVKTSKVYVRECSMVPAYSLLIFGGQIQVRHEKQMIVVDDWLEFEAPARIAVLIKELRKKVDLLLQEKTENPSYDISTSGVVLALLKLLESDGF